VYNDVFMAKVGIISMGCAKNLVDSEVMLGYLQEGGHELTPRQDQAEIIIVNTCGFIGPAKEESIQSILEMARLKEDGACRRLVVTGCLVERYRDEIRKEIPEVDAVLGTREIPEILEACREQPAYQHRASGTELYLYDDESPRVLTTPGYTAYIKISEGCDHPCTFCVIPQMRGRFRSRTPESVVREAARLAESGVVEINLIAQDSSLYGFDRGDRRGLSKLLRRLDEIDGLQWIRVLYLYPNTLYDELLDTIAESSKVCKYIDIPLQSASREVLKRMKRGGSRDSLRRLIDRIRRRIPDVTIRTTMIVGFPGESDSDFKETCEFIREIEFDRLGAFAFSDEEHAESYGLEGKIAEEVKQDRLARIMQIQAGISKKKNRGKIGKQLPVLVEGPSAESDMLWQGRLSSQTPEIDGVVYLNDGITEKIRPGQIQTVEITEAHEYDLIGRVLP